MHLFIHVFISVLFFPFTSFPLFISPTRIYFCLFWHFFMCFCSLMQMRGPPFKCAMGSASCILVPNTGGTRLTTELVNSAVGPRGQTAFKGVSLTEDALQLLVYTLTVAVSARALPPWKPKAQSVPAQLQAGCGDILPTAVSPWRSPLSVHKSREKSLSEPL